jgi:hypothetical protein
MASKKPDEVATEQGPETGPDPSETPTEASETPAEEQNAPPENDDVSQFEDEAGWIKAKRGHSFVTYDGSANVVEHVDTSVDPAKTYRLEPGVPVEVPKAIAEVLLTTPFEEFVVTDKVPAPPVEEE